MKYCHFVLTDLNEIKIERNSRKTKVTLGHDTWQFTKIDTLFLADFQNQVFSSSLNISGKYEPNLMLFESNSKLTHSE